MKRLLAVIFYVAIRRTVTGVDFVPPYPSNPVVLEGDPLAINCSAASPVGFPSVSFQKVGKDDMTFEDINTTSSRVYVNNIYRNDTAKGQLTTAVLHITSAKFSVDGNPSGMSYKCLLVLGGTKKELSFTVYVVRRIDLPKATVKGVSTTYGKPAKLTCDVTYKGNPTTIQLKKVVWMKDSAVIGQGSDAVDPITITRVTTQDGGDYVCAAMVNLMSTTMKKIPMGTARLNIELKMLNGIRQITGNLSGNATLECPAEGYPLNVTWMRVNREGHEVKIGEIPRLRGRYMASRPCPWCRYRLVIYNLQPRDQGFFVCKAVGKVKSARYHSNLEITQYEITQMTTDTDKPTTEATTEKPKSHFVPWIVYIVLGIVILLSLAFNAWLLYCLKRNKKNKTLESGDGQPAPPAKKSKAYDEVKIIKEAPQLDDQDNPSSVELEPLISNQSTDETTDLASQAPKVPSPTTPKELAAEAPNETTPIVSKEMAAEAPNETTPIASKESTAESDKIRATDSGEIQPTIDSPDNQSLVMIQGNSCECDPTEVKPEPLSQSKPHPKMSSNASNNPGYCILS